MTDMSLVLNANTNRETLAPNAGDRIWEGTRDGAAFMAGWTLKKALQGRLFVANFGTVTTPLTFLTTAANRPSWVVRVLAGTTIVPIRVETVLEAAAGTATEIDIRLAQNDLGNGTSSAASVGPINLRSDAPLTSAVIPRQLYTGDATAETNPVSVHRKTFPLAQATGLIPYDDIWIPDGWPVIVGPSSLEGFIAATTTQATGFVQVIWAELQSDYVKG